MHKFFIRTNEHYIGPFSVKEVMRMNVPSEVMIAKGSPEIWVRAEDIDFRELYKQELIEGIGNHEIMRGFGFDVANDPNLNDYQKGYLIHALEEYCSSNFKRPFSKCEKNLIAKLHESYHIRGLVRKIKSEIDNEDNLKIPDFISLGSSPITSLTNSVEDKVDSEKNNVMTMTNDNVNLPNIGGQNTSKEELAKRREVLKKKLLGII